MKLLPTFRSGDASATRSPLLSFAPPHYYILYLSKLRCSPRSTYHNDSLTNKFPENGRGEAFLLIHPHFRPQSSTHGRETNPLLEIIVRTFLSPHLYSFQSSNRSRFFQFCEKRTKKKQYTLYFARSDISGLETGDDTEKSSRFATFPVTRAYVRTPEKGEANE